MIILAGGQSRRMGVDKRRLELGPHTLLETALHSARRVCSEVVMVGRLPPDLRPPNVRCVDDCPGLRGPAAGIAAGLQAISSPRALVLACDMPFVTEALLRHLLTRAAEGWLAVAPRSAGRWEPLCAVYSTECGALVERECAGEHAAVRGFLENHCDEILALGEQELARFGEPSQLFANLNTPEDVKRAARLA
ncbi:MAG: molybdenum cofactor guanylyltransferase [Armatimonadetes bacterium]|nr:molybdenum cofactor guanylyltransferase [Armatimonadota bacterium]